MKEKTERVAVRVNAKLKARLLSAVSNSGIDEATIVRQCLEAFCDYFERQGAATFPLSIQPRPPDASFGEHRPSSLELNDKPKPKPRKP